MKKSLLLIVAVFASFSTWAQNRDTVVNIVEQTAMITRSSTLYIGEVSLDGQQSFYYLYSEDMTNTSTVLAAVRDCLSDFRGGTYSSMIVNYLNEGEFGIAACSNAAYESMMNSEWTSADNAGSVCLPNTTATSSSSENLFETNDVFAEKCSLLLSNNGITLVDDEGESMPVSSVLGVLSSSSIDDVTYTVIDGTLIKIIDRHMEYSCESVTVIYTKVELETADTGVEEFKVPSTKAGQRYNLIGQPVGKDYKGIVIEDGKKIFVR